MCQQHQESAKHAVKALTVCYSLGSPLGDIILFMPSTFEKWKQFSSKTQQSQGIFDLSMASLVPGFTIITTGTS